MIEAVTELQIPETYRGQRLDQTLAQMLPEYSRNRIQQWIKAGQVELDQTSMSSPKFKVQGGEQLRLLQAEIPEHNEHAAEAMSLDIVFEDDSLLVLNKPVGLVVHPAAGNWQGTLLNGLLHHCPALAALPRAGIVHRLDKDTSGLLVVAKDLVAHHSLVKQLAARTMSREYRGLVLGEVVAGSSVDEPIGRHPVERKRMAVRKSGKPAVTHFRVFKKYAGFTELSIKLETGRTHQIRVHMAHINLPLIGDSQYGGRRRYPKGLPEELRAAVEAFPRQALHAERLGLQHPATGETVSWQAEPPEDLQVLSALLARLA